MFRAWHRMSRTESRDTRRNENHLTAIPASYKNLMMSTLNLTFTDQFGYEYCAEADAILQRSTAQTSQSGIAQRIEAELT